MPSERGGAAEEVSRGAGCERVPPTRPRPRAPGAMMSTCPAPQTIWSAGARRYRFPPAPAAPARGNVKATNDVFDPAPIANTMYCRPLCRNVIGTAVVFAGIL